MWKITRGSNWSDEEVTNLIHIWKEPDMRERVDSKKRSKMDTWSDIATRLVQLGYPSRTGPQVHNKIKDLRRLYHKAKVELSGSDPGLIRQFPFYHMLNEVIGNRPMPGSRPSLNQSGVDDDDSSTDAFDDGSNSMKEYTLGDEECYQNDDKEQNDATATEPVAKGGDWEQNVATQLVAEGDMTHQISDPFPEVNHPENIGHVPQNLARNVEELQGHSSNAGQPPTTGKKRQRVSTKDKTVEALAKKMKDITAASDRKFLMIEEKRRREELEQRKEDRKCMLNMMELIKQSMEDRKRADEKRSTDFQALMEVLAKNSQNNEATSS